MPRMRADRALTSQLRERRPTHLVEHGDAVVRSRPLRAGAEAAARGALADLDAEAIGARAGVEDGNCAATALRCQIARMVVRVCTVSDRRRGARQTGQAAMRIRGRADDVAARSDALRLAAKIATVRRRRRMPQREHSTDEHDEARHDRGRSHKQRRHTDASIRKRAGRDCDGEMDGRGTMFAGAQRQSSRPRPKVAGPRASARSAELDRERALFRHQPRRDSRSTLAAPVARH